MGYGLLNSGTSTKDQALSGMEQNAQAEQQRNIANDNIEAAEDAAKKTNAATGASVGATAGVTSASTAISSGAAAAGTGTLLASGLATGGIGLAAGLLLTELF